MESTRQKKVSRLLQKELASIFHKEAQALIGNTMVSVTIVRVSPDLANANVFLSIFPSEKRDEIVKGVQSNTPLIRHEMASRTKNQLRRMPELLFFGDDTLDYLEEIDKSLNGEDENPIQNPSVLPRRKKN